MSSHSQICPEQFQWGQNLGNCYVVTGRGQSTVIFFQRILPLLLPFVRGTFSKLKFLTGMIIGCLSESSFICDKINKIIKYADKSHKTMVNVINFKLKSCYDKANLENTFIYRLTHLSSLILL